MELHSSSHRFLTLHREDKRYWSYLLGTFSQSERAYLVDTLSPHTDQQRTTFRIVPISEAQAPVTLVVFFTGIRPLLLPLTIGPAVAVLFFCLHLGVPLYFWKTILTFLSVFAFHGAIFLFNDYYDHLSGIDRWSSLGGSRIIQRGWVTADRVKQWAQYCGLFGFLCGVPVLLKAPLLPLGLISLLSLGMVLGFSRPNRQVKYLGLGNLMVFCGMGPLLTMGISFALVGDSYKVILFMGGLFGLSASLCTQLRNFETLLFDSQNGIGTMISQWSWSKIKLFIFFALLVILVGLIIFVEQVAPSGIYWLVFLPVFGSGMRLGVRLYRVRSPVSSYLFGLWREGLALHFLMAVGISLLFYLMSH